MTIERPQAAAERPRKRKPQPRQKRVPQRTCIACQQTRPKRELIRVVRSPVGHVSLDPTSKKSGRGAYVCARRSCWDIALKKGKLERALDATLTEDDRAGLEAYYASLPPESATAAKEGASMPQTRTRAKPRDSAKTSDQA